MTNKLLVFCLDALCTMDLEKMKDLKNFGWVLERGAVVRHIEPVYPSLTYPCHCSIITGTYVQRHQVTHNEIVEVENPNPVWFNQRSSIKCKTIFDFAKEAGLSTAALSWPVMGKAELDFNMPMIVPIGYSGDNPRQFLEGNATTELLDRYYYKHGRYLIGKDRNLDMYTMSMALDVLEDYDQPDILFVKMCDLDTVKHQYGIANSQVDEQLRKHDEELGSLMEALRRKGTLENTNIVILGDHGQMDVNKNLNMNLLLKEHGFIRTNEDGKLIDYDAYCHSAALSAWIQLKNPEDQAMREKVHQFLKDCMENPEYNIGYLFTKEEAERLFGLTGPLDFVIEGKEAMSFGTTLKGTDLFEKHLPEGYHNSLASHGHLPFRDETTTFFGCGPNIRQGVVLERAKMVDEAPTLAKMMQFEMMGVDGNVLSEIIK